MKNKANKRARSDGHADTASQTLYPDALSEIFSHLGARKKSHIALVSQHFGTLFDNNSAWKKRYEKHFPHRKPQASFDHAVNYRNEYYAAQDHEYGALSQRIKDIFYCIKENEVDDLINLNVTYEELTQTDINGCSVHEWALNKGNQRILDYFFHQTYQYFLTNCQNGIIAPDQVDETGLNLLHKAVLCKQSASYIQSLIQDHGFDANAASTSGHTPLMMAVTTGSISAASALISNGANVNLPDNENRMPLAYAAANGLTGMVTLLVQKKAMIITLPDDNGKTAVWEACENGHDACVRVLLDHGAYIGSTCKQQSLLYIAARNGHVQCVNTLLMRDKSQIKMDNNSGRTPLFAAAKHGHHDCVRALLASEAKWSVIDIHGESPVYAAAKRGHTECVRILESYGADMDQILDEEDGMTALMLAAANADVDAVHILLNHDVDVDAVNPHNQATALHYAIMAGCAESMQMLLESGTDHQAEYKPSKWEYLQLLKSKFNGRHNYMIDKVENMVAEHLSVTPFELAQDIGDYNAVDVLLNHYLSSKPSFY